MKTCSFTFLVVFASLGTACSQRPVGSGVNDNNNTANDGGEVDGDANTNGNTNNFNNNQNTDPFHLCQQTCQGCCAPSGECLAGRQNDHCGTNGEECKDCAALGGTCQGGVCVGTESCGPSNCSGCCTVEGDCLSGDTYEACGQNGASCQQCNEAHCVEGLCCRDQDGDGYGAGCLLGDDCDDTAPGITGACDANGCPQGWAYVPAGMFLFGCDYEDDPACWENQETELQELFLDAFCIEITEVSVEAFLDCQAFGICPQLPEQSGFCNWFPENLPERLDHPINCMFWSAATNYCQNWLGGDLPTEKQWEKAARGTDGRTFPWGEEMPCDCNRCNSLWQCLATDDPFYTWPVGYLTLTEAIEPPGSY